MFKSSQIPTRPVARQMSPRCKARQISRLALSRSILAVKKAFWPESGWILAVSGFTFSYGIHWRDRVGMNNFIAFFFLLPLTAARKPHNKNNMKQT